MTPKSKSQAINWLIDKAIAYPDSSRVFTGKTISTKMYSDLIEYVKNLNTELKIVKTKYFNWVEDGFWFELQPQLAKPGKHDGRRNRVLIRFECGIYEN